MSSWETKKLLLRGKSKATSARKKEKNKIAYKFDQSESQPSHRREKERGFGKGNPS